MDTLLFTLNLCFLLVVGVYAHDNIAQIEFQRIFDNEQNRPQSGTEILADYLSNDTFRIICSLNDTTYMKYIHWLVMRKIDGPLYAIMQNYEPLDTEKYQKLYVNSNTSSWTAVGRFDNVTSNSRYSTFGVSRPVSSMTCSDSGVYTCDVQYSNTELAFENGTIHKQLQVQVVPSKITKKILSASKDEDGIFSDLTNSTTVVDVGQILQLQCTANTGSFNTSVQIVWMKSSLENSGHLAPFSSDKHILGEPKAFGMCEFEKTDSIIYEVSQEDAERTSENGLHFQCYVHITSMDWKTPEKQRQNFSFDVHSDDGNDGNSGSLNEKTAKEFPIITTIISGITGGVCVFVILGITGILLKRKYSNGCFPKADERSDENSRNPDAPVDTVPSARDSEIYTEIEGTSDPPANSTGETSFIVQTTEPSHYEELRVRESNTYTELDSPMYENICK